MALSKIARCFRRKGSARPVAHGPMARIDLACACTFFAKRGWLMSSDRAISTSQPGRDLSAFTGEGYDIGRGRAVQAIWVAVDRIVFRRIWCPARLRVWILRRFGASVGPAVLIRHDVQIHWPWKLSIGEKSWIGAGAWVLNLEHVRIGRNVCISQGAMLCTGSHDRRSPSFEFDNAPITIEDGAWIAARAIVLRGVTIGRGATVGAGAVANRSLPNDGMLVASSVEC